MIPSLLSGYAASVLQSLQTSWPGWVLVVEETTTTSSESRTGSYTKIFRLLEFSLYKLPAPDLYAAVFQQCALWWLLCRILSTSTTSVISCVQKRRVSEVHPVSLLNSPATCVLCRIMDSLTPDLSATPGLPECCCSVRFAGCRPLSNGWPEQAGKPPSPWRTPPGASQPPLGNTSRLSGVAPMPGAGHTIVNIMATKQTRFLQGGSSCAEQTKGTERTVRSSYGGAHTSSRRMG